MLITGQYIKLTRSETESIIRFCLDVYIAPFGSQGDGLGAQIMERYNEKRREELAGYAKKLLVSLIQETDLWAEEFFRAVEYADQYAKLFGVNAPEWFTSQRQRSKSREQFRGLSDEDAKHRVRRWLNWVKIEEIAAEKGIALSTLGMYRPGGMVDAQAEYDRWRSTERARSKAQRANRKQERAEAAAEVKSIPAERRAFRLQDVLTENRALKRENAQLRGAANKRPDYRQAVEAQQSARHHSQMQAEIDALQAQVNQLSDERDHYKAAFLRNRPVTSTGYGARPANDPRAKWFELRSIGDYAGADRALQKAFDQKTP